MRPSSTSIALVIPPNVLVVINAISEIINMTKEIAAIYVSFKTLAASKIFSLSSLKINNCASSADKKVLSGNSVIDVPSSVSFSECRDPFSSLNTIALLVSLLKFSISNKSSSELPNC